MATTIPVESDPTFAAYENAKNYHDFTAARDEQTGFQRNTEDTNQSALKLAYEQTDQVAANTANYRAAGFGLSGPRAQAEDKIRRDIALKVQDLLLQNTRTTQDVTNQYLDQLASGSQGLSEQDAAARNRLTSDYATSGYGL